jgi:dipeptidyl aminopeptidase/acylaminoacyl peptidase
MRLRGLKKYALGAGGMLVLVVLIVSGTVLGVTSASAGESAFPGRNGRILLDQGCVRGAQGQDLTCGFRYVTMNADGSSFRVLRSNKRWYGARWSPDGKRILVASGVFTEQPTSISVLNPAGGKVTSVWGFRRGFRTDLSVGGPDWLSARQIVFLGWRKSRTGIYRMALDGTRLRKLRAFSGGVRGLSASPDGRRIAFTHHVARRYTDELYLMNADGSGLRRLGSRCRLGATDWSPDSRRLLVVSAATREGSSVECALDYDVDLVPANGGAATRVFTEKYVETGPGQGYGIYPPRPVFSPDGTRIAFLVQRLPPTGWRGWNSVWVIKANGTGLREVRHAEVVLDENGCVRCVGYSSIAWQPVRR